MIISYGKLNLTFIPFVIPVLSFFWTNTPPLLISPSSIICSPDGIRGKSIYRPEFSMHALITRLSFCSISGSPLWTAPKSKSSFDSSPADQTLIIVLECDGNTFVPRVIWCRLSLITLNFSRAGCPSPDSYPVDGSSNLNNQHILLGIFFLREFRIDTS